MGAIPEKIQTGFRIYFFDPPPIDKIKLNPWIFHKVVLKDAFGKFQGQKQGPLEIPHFYIIIIIILHVC